MKLAAIVFVLLVAPTTALAPSSQPHNRAAKRIRSEVSLQFQGSAPATREYMSDVAWKEATKSLKIRALELQQEQPQPSYSNFKAVSVQWEQEKTRKTAPPSEKTLLLLGCILAVNAGFLNGLAMSGILGPKVGVAAVTGAWTNTATGLASGNLSLFATQLSLVMSYFFGSLVNGFVHAGGLDWTTHSKKRFNSRTLLGVAGLVVAAHCLKSIPLLAMAVGMQTSWTSMLFPGNLIRSAHFSGITSDIGTKVGRMFRIGLRAMPSEQMRKLEIQARLLGSFCLGSVLSVVFRQTRVGLMASAALLVGSFVALNLRHFNVKETYQTTVRPWMLPAPLL